MSENFIRTLTEIHRQRYINTIQELVRENIPLGVFLGFTFNSQHVERILQLQNLGLNLKFICVIDESFREKINSENISIITLKELSNLHDKPQCILYIGSHTYDTAFEFYFARLGIQTLMTHFMRNMNYEYEFAYANLSNLFEVYNLFYDKESRISFLHALKGRITGKISDYHFAPEPQYWLQDFFPTKSDVVIDGGAYDAGTSVDFASQGAKVFAFEMDSVNYERCINRIANYDYDITMENMGLSSEESDSSYYGGGSAGSRKAGVGEVIPQTGGGVFSFYRH